MCELHELVTETFARIPFVGGIFPITVASHDLELEAQAAAEVAIGGN
jgi:hypothetical protein